jgi:hypothetical protein
VFDLRQLVAADAKALAHRRALQQIEHHRRGEAAALAL